MLDDKEINEFQRICFNAPLESEELTKIKALVAFRLNDTSPDTTISNFLSSLEGYVDETELSTLDASGGGLSIVGFIWLQNHFIQSGRLETTWKALRTFGYGEDLSLSESFLFPRFDVPSDSAVELSPLGYQFLTDVFEIFDKVRSSHRSVKSRLTCAWCESRIKTVLCRRPSCSSSSRLRPEILGSRSTFPKRP